MIPNVSKVDRNNNYNNSSSICLYSPRLTIHTCFNNIYSLVTNTKRYRKSWKVDSQSGNPLAKRKFNTKRQKKILHSKRVEIMNNIVKDIHYMLKNDFSRAERYSPIPFLLLIKH